MHGSRVALLFLFLLTAPASLRAQCDPEEMAKLLDQAMIGAEIRAPHNLRSIDHAMDQVLAEYSMSIKAALPGNASAMKAAALRDLNLKLRAYDQHLLTQALRASESWPAGWREFLFRGLFTVEGGKLVARPWTAPRATLFRGLIEAPDPVKRFYEITSRGAKADSPSDVAIVLDYLAEPANFLGAWVTPGVFPGRPFELAVDLLARSPLTNPEIALRLRALSRLEPPEIIRQPPVAKGYQRIEGLDPMTMNLLLADLALLRRGEAPPSFSRIRYGIEKQVPGVVEALLIADASGNLSKSLKAANAPLDTVTWRVDPSRIPARERRSSGDFMRLQPETDAKVADILSGDASLPGVTPMDVLRFLKKYELRGMAIYSALRRLSRGGSPEALAAQELLLVQYPGAEGMIAQ
jgi:hypothetical protein